MIPQSFLSFRLCDPEPLRSSKLLLHVINKKINLPLYVRSVYGIKIIFDLSYNKKKYFQRSEYSVAVASATRTISNFSNGKQQRAMSFQALNANAYRFDNRDRRRDHSVDLG